MKTIGLIGGMSWESTALYYQLINRGVAERLGGYHSARLLLYSVDFAEIEQLQRSGDWAVAGEILADAARALERGGAEFLVMTTNTMHKVANYVTSAVDIPLLHIVDPTADAVLAAGIQRIALLGTRFTMEQDFYRGGLEQRGLQVLTPPEADRALVHRIIYEELCHGIVRAEARAEFVRIIAAQVAVGAQGVILGCTEIGMLVGADDAPVPVFDTTVLHAQATVERALVD